MIVPKKTITQKRPKPSQQTAKKVTDFTHDKIQQIVQNKTRTAYGTSVNNLGQKEAHYIRYLDNEKTNKERIVKMQEAQQDPFNPSRFRHKIVPKGIPNELPAPIRRSPKRKLIKKDYQDWKIPPCISNWKNNKGYTIPLHMRLSSNGRSLTQHTINQRFADLVDTLYVAEKQTRQQLQNLASIQKTINYKQHLFKQQRLRQQAAKLRQQRRILQQEESQQQSNQSLQQRDNIRHLRRRELERQTKFDKMGIARKKHVLEKERDVTDKVNYNAAQPTYIQDVVDQRVFDREAYDKGYGSSDQENLYDKPLFTDKQRIIKETKYNKLEDLDQFIK